MEKPVHSPGRNCDAQMLIAEYMNKRSRQQDSRANTQTFTSNAALQMRMMQMQHMRLPPPTQIEADISNCTHLRSLAWAH